jgi:sugar lactone lactonase YvrE
MRTRVMNETKLRRVRPRGLRGSLCCLALGLAWAGCAPPPPPPPLFYPPLPQRPRIQFLRQLNSSQDVEAPVGSFRAFVLGKDSGERVIPIGRPYGLAMDQGKLYVCDSGSHRVAVLDFKNHRFETFGDKGQAKLRTPINICLGPNGEKYVCDTGLGAVVVFDRDNKLLHTFRREEGLKPSDVLWLDGELYVADLKANAVLVLDPKTGRLVRQIGKAGKEPGEFYFPTNLAVGPNGHLYVSDTMNARVQELDKSGKPIRTIGQRGMLIGDMVRPKGIAVDREGRLYVADAAPQTVQIYDTDSKLLFMLGAPEGEVPDAGTLTLPAKVIISYEGIEYFSRYASPDFQVELLIFVSSQFAQSKVSVYGLGKYLKPLSESADQIGPRTIKVEPPKGPEGAEKKIPPPEDNEETPPTPAPKSGEK